MKLLIIFLVLFFSSKFLTNCTGLQPNLDYLKQIATNSHDPREKIVVIDSGIRITDYNKKYLCNDGHYDVTETSLHDYNGHGTNIAGIIARKLNPQTQCIVIIKYFFDTHGTMTDELQALKIAYQIPNVKVINFSSGGFEPYLKERHLIEKIISNNIYFVTAAGNKSTNLDFICNYFPACYNIKSKYFRVVGNGLNQHLKSKYTNYGSQITDWRIGDNILGFDIVLSGTSQSTAILSSELMNK